MCTHAQVEEADCALHETRRQRVGGGENRVTYTEGTSIKRQEGRIKDEEGEGDRRKREGGSPPEVWKLLRWEILHSRI